FVRCAQSPRSLPSLPTRCSSDLRGLIEGYFSAPRMAAFEPVCREIAEDLALSALAQPQTELIASFAQPFALRIQCAFMGWPPGLDRKSTRLNSSHVKTSYAGLCL